MNSYRGPLEAIDRILNRGGDADDVLRAVVGVLRERAGFAWAGVTFVERDALVLGPNTGVPDETKRLHLPVIYEGAQVAVLQVDGAPEDAIEFLERVALLISPHCLVGWDTGGVPWGEVG
jgi:hypothetical protein